MKGDYAVKVEVKLSPDIEQPYIVVYARELTEEICKLIDRFGAERKIFAATENHRTVFLKPEEIYMVQIESGRTKVVCQTKTYTSAKRLYELEAQLGKQFMRISKSTLINLEKIDSIQPSFNGGVCCVLKNGCKDYISRKYFSAFKSYFGL